MLALGAKIVHVETDDYLTADEAAEALGIARRSVYYYERYLDGFPQAVRIGRTPMWNRKEIEEWRAAHPARKRGDAPEVKAPKPRRARPGELKREDFVDPP